MVPSKEMFHFLEKAQDKVEDDNYMTGVFVCTRNGLDMSYVHFVDQLHFLSSMIVEDSLLAHTEGWNRICGFCSFQLEPAKKKRSRSELV